MNQNWPAMTRKLFDSIVFQKYHWVSIILIYTSRLFMIPNPLYQTLRLSSKPNNIKAHIFRLLRVSQNKIHSWNSRYSFSPASWKHHHHWQYINIPNIKPIKRKQNTILEAILTQHTSKYPFHDFKLPVQYSNTVQKSTRTLPSSILFRLPEKPEHQKLKTFW